jgi:hypothetical protein
MDNQEYLDRMTPKQREQSERDGIAGIIELQADCVRGGSIIVDPDSLQDDGKSFSFKYQKA